MKRGVLLMNIGSPEAPTVPAVRAYLNEFLMDPHVMDLPWLFRMVLVQGIILPRRPARSAQAYKSIWGPKGSPLVHSCVELARSLQVELGMTYGSPSVHEAIDRLLATGVEEIHLLPLFPQSAMATTGACVSKVNAVLKGRAALRVVPPFHTHPAFIQSVAKLLSGVEEHILFSYHGLPLRHVEKMSAPNYHLQCVETTQALATAAGIDAARYSLSFQSRLGRSPWLAPYTEETLRQLPALGKTRLAVICPGFFCDCLETLEELGVRGRETFMQAGGESFRMIPCLNHSSAAIHCLETLLHEHEA